MNLLKEARLKKGLSLEEAAKQLSIRGGYLSQIENGQRQISAERAEEIADLYNEDLNKIFLPTRYAVRVV